MISVIPNIITESIANYNYLPELSNLGENYDELLENQKDKIEEEFFNLLKTLQQEGKLTKKAENELNEVFDYFYYGELFDNSKFHFYLTQDESILFKTSSKFWKEELIIRGEYFFDEEPYDIYVGIDTKESMLEGYAGNIKEVLPRVSKFIENMIFASKIIKALAPVIKVIANKLGKYLEELQRDRG